jgi:hypothetical protein
MGTTKFDIAIIFNDEEVLEIIIGKGNGLLKKIKDSDNWDFLLEECFEEKTEFDTIDDLKEFFDKNNLKFQTKLTIKKEVYYKV